MADRAVGIPIVREGLPFVAAASGLTILAGTLGWVAPASVLGAVTFLTAWFFRNPSRRAPQTAGAVVAPGDGRVLAVHEEYEPRYLKDRGTRVS
ncbi:MAG: phosphatidylserine decarboxylase, partial [Nitrospiraceae bacterium]